MKYDPFVTLRYDLLGNLDEKIKEKISEKWHEDHFDDMTQEWFDREYKLAFEKIENFLFSLVGL